MPNTVTLTFTAQDGGGGAEAGQVTIVPTSVVVDAGVTVVSQDPVVRSLSGGAVSVSLFATDNTGTTPAAGFWAYNITLPGWTAPKPYLLKFSDGATQRFDNLTPAVASVTYGPAASGGGFTNPMTTLGDIMYENATPAAARLAGSTSATKNFLTQTGNGSVSAAPAWGTIAAGDLPYQPWQFHVAPIGGGSDDTPNLRTALTNAGNYMANNQGYAEIWVDPGLYTLSSALTNSGNGNCQLPLPLIGTGVSGGILVIRSTSGNGGANPYFSQTVAQKSGAIFKSTLTAQSVNGTYGAPYILGGPGTSAYAYGSGVYNNLMVILDGITFMPTQESGGPTMGGAFLATCAKAQVVSGAYFPDTTLTNMNATQPANFWANGLYMPYPLNNDDCVIGTWAGYGAYRAALITSHTSAQRIAALYCHRGIGYDGSSDGHGAWIGNLSAEFCDDAIYNEGGSAAPISVGLLDCESIGHYTTGYHVNDGSSNLTGRIQLNTLGGGGSAVLVNGASNVEIIAANQARGHVTSPGVSSSTSAFQNPFWRHAWVQVTGGTVSQIAIDGTNTGSTSGFFRVPSGRTITLTYSVAPAWTWWLD